MRHNKSRTTRESGTHAAIYPSQRALASRELPVAVVGCCTPGSRVHVFAVASEVKNFGCHLRLRSKRKPRIRPHAVGAARPQRSTLPAPTPSLRLPYERARLGRRGVRLGRIEQPRMYAAGAAVAVAPE